MRSFAIGVVALLAFLAVVGHSSGVAQAGDEVRFRALLMASMVDPLSSGHADFDQRPDRIRFRVEVDNITEPGIGIVVVTRNAGTPSQETILQAQIAIVGDPLQGTAFGNLSLDSRLGDSIPVMIIGDTVNVLNASGDLILKGTLEGLD